MRFRLLIFVLFWAITRVQAQQDSAKTTLTLASMYNSNINYYGQVTTEKYPYILFNATLRLPSGLYFSGGGYKLLNFGPILSETDLGIGYDHDFSDKLTAGIAYSHSFFPSNSPLLQAANSNNINASSAYTWPWFKTDLSVDFAFGKQNDIFLSFDNSKEIELGTVFGSNLISITPAFTITAGTTRFYESYLVEKSKKQHSNGNGKSSSAPGIVNGTTVEIVENSTSQFKLLAYSFKLPLNWSSGNFLAEASYQFSLLGNRKEAEVKHQQSFFGLAVYYQF
ncbi:hypothetical protein [Pedobacter zeae]|uniref:Outer membrane protein beta-barrel domain-containing protein n=1 Tax=Pedobacter zeae TaxID=1737356 RepID=A0A7W6KH92_9SPHI|nr:hypothetical protein [Pedobacter zeae]MBB4110492.1 hypothetical protein [Pedobacter zeae]GGH18190.1 hypothetical protein GCM10007422_42260 [Pedobacter zeae]